MYTSKLLKYTEADGANEISRNAAIAVPLQYLSNFCRSLEMLLINCKVELKLKWTYYCVLFATIADNNDGKARLNNMLVCRHPGLCFWVHPAGWKKFFYNFDMEKAALILI